MLKNYLRAMTLSAVAMISANGLAQETTIEIDRAKYPQLTDVPTMYIEVDDGKEITEKVSTYDSATIVIVDQYGTIKERNERVGIRLRGNSTKSSAKKPYRLKFPSKTGLLKKPDGSNEFADAKSWVLLANSYDKSMIHNALTYELGKFIGLPFCPCYKFVDLVYNGDYRGTYQISDQVQQDSKRVNIKKTGWLLELTRQSFVDADDVYMQNGGIYALIKNPDTDDYDADSLKNVMKPYFDGLINAVNNQDFNDATGYRKYIDVESLIDYYIAQEITGNYDAWVQNYIYKKADEEKFKIGPLWDFDLSFGNKTGMENILTWQNTGSTYQPMASIMEKIFKDPQFVVALNKRWKELTDKGITAYLKEKAESLATVVAQTQAKNYSLSSKGNAWSLSANEFSWSGGNVYSSYDESIAAISTFLDTHVAYMTQRFEEEAQKVADAKATVALDAQNWEYQFNNSLYDAASDTYTKLNRLADVTIANRTIDGAGWNTICLPFSATQEQLEQAFGCAYTIREFTGVEGTTMKFAEPEGKKIVAGVPYLIRLDDASKKATLSFSDVILTTKQPQTVTIGDYGFAGTFWQTTLNTDGTHLVLGADDELYTPSTSGNAIYGIRAYFVVPQGSSAKLMIADYDDVTGIATVGIESGCADRRVYNTSGQLVGKTTGGLKKGIYIRNGKKVVIK